MTVHLTVDSQGMGEIGGCDMQQRSSSRDSNHGPLRMWHARLTARLPARPARFLFGDEECSRESTSLLWFVIC